MPTFIQGLKDPNQHQSNEGFTLVEVLIAGAIMAMVLVSRQHSALASSAKQAGEKQRNNNIQMLQKIAIYAWMLLQPKPESACDAPAETLAAVS